MSDHGDTELRDHLLIRRVVETISRGQDRLDRELLNSGYWPDAVVDMGPWAGTGAEVADVIIGASKNYAATMHMLSQSNIALHGDSASGDTYFTGHHRTEVGEKISLFTAYGRYVDLFERRNGEWRIARRICIMEHMHTQVEDSANALPMDMFRPAKREDRSDLSYEGR